MALTLDTTIGAGGLIIAEASGSPPVTTASFSTAANVRLVALTSHNGDASTTITVSGAGLSWAEEVSEYTREGGAAIWVAYSAAALSSVTVSTTRSNPFTGSGASMSLVGILGAEVTHGGAENTAQSSSGTPSCGLTTTRDGSYVLACASDWSAAGDFAIGGGQSPAGTLLNTHQIAGEYSGGQSRTTSPVSGLTAVTMAFNIATRNYNMAAIEIRDATAGAGGVARPFQPIPFVQAVQHWSPI